MLNWLTAECPVCHRSYKHLSSHKPVTCGEYKCVKSYFAEGGETALLKDSWYFKQLNKLASPIVDKAM